MRLKPASLTIVHLAFLLTACAPQFAPTSTPSHNNVVPTPAVATPTTEPTPATEAITDPVTIVSLYYDALNAKDLDKAMSYVAAEAVFINPNGKYESPEAIRESLQGNIADNITFELSNFRSKDGRVVYDYKVLQNGGLLETGDNGLTIVKDGKIVFDGTEATEPK